MPILFTRRRLERPTTEHEIGIPLILMSKTPSWPLAKAWKTTGSGEPKLAVSLKAKGLYELETMTYKLSQLRFNQMGSLFERGGIFLNCPSSPDDSFPRLVTVALRVG